MTDWPPPTGKYADEEPADAELLLSPSELYHENSKLHPSNRRLGLWIDTVNRSPEIRRFLSRPTTRLRGYPTVALPRDLRPSPLSFETIVMERRSRHRFSGKPLTLATLAQILLLGDGVSARVRAADGIEWALRTAPSGGGLYPVELYCVAWQVDGLAPGLYHYDPMAHALAQVRPGELRPALAEATYLHQTLEEAAACLILSAVFGRSKFKYGERAYRFVLLEAGHIAQNVLLAATAAGCGGLPVGGFTDDKVNALLDVDGVREAALYLIVLGGEP
jgi:SagB-type dehydrogenase family enzyme